MSISVLKETEKHELRAHKQKRKQISRIIKHLRDQLPPEQSAISLPSDDCIDQLVHHALNDHPPSSHDWHLVIYQTLQRIVSYTNSSHINNNHQAMLINRETIDNRQIKAFAMRILALINEREIYFQK